jgi:hypothetical protein
MKKAVYLLTQISVETKTPLKEKESQIPQTGTCHMNRDS